MSMLLLMVCWTALCRTNAWGNGNLGFIQESWRCDVATTSITKPDMKQ